MGYTYLTSRDELNSTKATKMWGLFAPQTFAADANDPSKIASEIVAYDKAVKAALDFAKKNKN